MSQRSNSRPVSPVRTNVALPSLATFNNGDFQRGRSVFVEFLWVVASALVMRSSLPASGPRKMLLRLFGASIGPGVVVKQNVTVKFPWRLKIGANSWIGEGVWIDNLADVSVGADACISQGAYLCTGSHDWTSRAFDLKTKPIVIGDGAWVCARATIGPGVNLGDGAVVLLGAVATRDVPSMYVLKADGVYASRRPLRPQ
jgi:putative colanic acid biosynthesis acetyltransferase WcaF